MADKKNIISTVRGRKGASKQAAQRFLPFAEIRNDSVILKNGGIRAILQIEAINFNLKSETEQQGIIAGYGNFVNTLGFPVQIYIRSSRTNIDDYLAQVTAIGSKHTNPLLQQQTQNYVNFMRRLLDVADIMQKRFFIIIPIDRNVRRKTILEQFFDWVHPDDTTAKSAYRSRELSTALREVQQRVELVEAGLGSIGLHCKRMGTRDLLELYYQIYNPKTANQEKIPQDLDALKFDKTTL